MLERPINMRKKSSIQKAFLFLNEVSHELRKQVVDQSKIFNLNGKNKRSMFKANDLLDSSFEEKRYTYLERFEWPGIKFRVTKKKFIFGEYLLSI